MKTKKEAMPCPRCGTIHERGEYIQRPDLKGEDSKGMPVAPADIKCQCGVKLRHVVPLFIASQPGWHWRIL